jgi:hypothetical protein
MQTLPDRLTIDAPARHLFSLRDRRLCQRRSAHHDATVRAGIGYAVAILRVDAIERHAPIRANAGLNAARDQPGSEAIDSAADFGDPLADRLLRF